jgi:acyl-CoA thioester hydrolase
MKSFESLIPLRWGDMDAMGHLNNTMYFRLIEEARIQWFNAIGLTADGKGIGPILAHASCDFVKPMTYPSTARVIQTLGRLGNSSVQLDCVIESEAEPGLAYARCKSVVVCLDYGTGKTVPWSNELRALLS